MNSYFSTFSFNSLSLLYRMMMFINLPYNELLDLQRQFFNRPILLFNYVHEILHYILILIELLGLSLAREMLHFSLKVIDELRFLSEFDVEGADLCVSLNYDADISRLFVLYEQVLELLYLVEQLDSRVIVEVAALQEVVRE